MAAAVWIKLHQFRASVDSCAVCEEAKRDVQSNITSTIVFKANTA